MSGEYSASRNLVIVILRYLLSVILVSRWRVLGVGSYSGPPRVIWVRSWYMWRVKDYNFI